MKKEKKKKILKYVILNKKYNTHEKCAKKIADSLYKSDCSKESISDAYSLLSILVGDEK